MSYYCQLHSLQYQSVCLEHDCPRKGAICTMCVGSHDQHKIMDLHTFLLQQQAQIQRDIQLEILTKLEMLKTHVHNQISKQLIQLGQIDEKRKRQLITSLLNEKMNSTLFQSKLTELIQREQLRDYEYLDLYAKELDFIDHDVRYLLEKFPKRAQQSFVGYPNEVEPLISQSLPQASLSPQISNRSKKLIFSDNQPSPLSVSPLRKNLLQRDLTPVGAFNNHKMKNYFTEQQDTQRSNVSKNTQILTKAFDLDRSEEKIYNRSFDQQHNSEKEKSNSRSFNQSNYEEENKFVFNPPPQSPVQLKQISLPNGEQPGSNPNFIIKHATSPQAGASTLNNKSSSFIKSEQSKDQEPLSPIMKQSSQSNASLFLNQTNLDQTYLSSRSQKPVLKQAQNLPNNLDIFRLQEWRAHDRSIKDICLMDEDKLVSGSKDGTIKIWDKRTMQLKITLKDHTDQIFAVAFSKKRLIASGSADRTVKIWKPQPSWKIAFTAIGHQGRVRCVTFIGDYVASGSEDTTIRLWDSEGKEMFVHKTEGRVCALLGIEKNILIFGSGKTIGVFDVQMFKQLSVRHAHDNLVSSLQITAESQGTRILFSGGRDQAIRVWSYPQIELIQEVVDDYPVITLCWNAANFHLYAGMVGSEQEGKISIWKVDAKLEKVQEIYDNPYGCNKILFDGQALYSAHENRRINSYQIS